MAVDGFTPHLRWKLCQIMTLNRPILIPRIQTPTSLVEDIIGVQPMMDDSGENFVLKITPTYGEREYSQGDWQHSFLNGWQIYYGTDWIDIDVWWKIKVAGL
jgi:hypothetical protein